MKLIIDLEKAQLNRGKLVLRRVLVRGKDGKIFTRNQWVNPEQEQKQQRTSSNQQEEVNHRVQQEEPVQKTKKEHIDEFVKKMSTEDKQKFVDEHGIEYKRNEHPAIDHKNKVVAIKQHLHNNPHLAGAENLPDNREATDKEIKHRTAMDFIEKFTKGKDKEKMRPYLHQIIHDEGIIPNHRNSAKLGLQDRPEDPNEYMDPKKAPIHHMHRLSILKEHLMNNPHRIKEIMNSEKYHHLFSDDDRDGHDIARQPDAVKDKPKVEPKVEPPKQVSGSMSMKDAMKTLDRDNMYAFMKKHGIAESDPKNDDSIKAGMKPIAHMRNVEALKRYLADNPDKLGELGLGDVDLNDLDKHASDSKGTVPKKKDVAPPDDHSAKVEHMFDKMSRESKEELVDLLRNHPLVDSSRMGQDGEMGYRKALGEIKRLLKEHPEVFKEHEKEISDYYLIDTTKPNVREVTRFLKEYMNMHDGLKNGERVMVDSDMGGWVWYIDNTAQITRNEQGEPILSIVDAGHDGSEFNELEVPLQDFRDFLDKLRSKGDSKEPVVEKKPDLPLAQQGASNIYSELSKDISKLTPEVANALRTDIGKTWEKLGYTLDVNRLALGSGKGPVDMYKAVLKELGVPLDMHGNIDKKFYNTDEGKSLMYGHKIEKTKKSNSLSLVINNKIHDNDTWLLHESAKHWTPEERQESRQEFVSNYTMIDDRKLASIGRDKDRVQNVKKNVSRLIREASSFIPYDMFTDMHAQGYVNYKFGADSNGSSYNHFNRILEVNHNFLNNLEGINDNTRLRDIGGRYRHGMAMYETTHFADTIAHELAHAIDHYLSSNPKTKPVYGDPGFLTWGETENSKKYLNSLGVNPNLVKDSYMKAVTSSNPSAIYVKAINGNVPYIMHLDEFITAYEGRVYDTSLPMPESGERREDTEMAQNRKANGLIGLEHWAENVSRMVNAVMAHKEYVKDTGDNIDLDTWAEKMYNDSQIANRRASRASVTGDLTKDTADSRLSSYGELGEKLFGKAYHIMKQKHPDLVDGINKLLLRDDFINSKVEKSEKPEFLYINL